jgi:hypothetical protein
VATISKSAQRNQRPHATKSKPDATKSKSAATKSKPSPFPPIETFQTIKARRRAILSIFNRWLERGSTFSGEVPER